MNVLCSILALFALCNVVLSQDNMVIGDVPSLEVKCLVCKATVDEMQIAIGKVDPKKKTEIKAGRMLADGTNNGKLIQYIKSEGYLTELMEDVCDKMDDYAKAKLKTNGKLIVLKMMTETGMNSMMSEVDFVQDNDLNKSLKHFCLEVLEDNEVEAMKLFMEDGLDKNLGDKLCTQSAKYCLENEEADFEDDYEDRDEL